MFNTEQEKIRIEKLKKLKDRGVIPYPYKFDITHTLKELRDEKTKLITAQKLVSVAGRILGIRGHGKIIFADIRDGSGKVQLYLKKSELKDKYELLQFFDIGDFIGVKGILFETHTKELTIFVNDFTLLSKSLHPLPEKWHGLQDKELRHRKRWLDLIMNPEVKRVFETRTKIIDQIRSFLNSKGFIEVETPVLQPIYGGGFAEPFKSYYKSLDREFFLRISDELYLKRLIIGGFDKVYEFAKDFRNEGMDRTHNPEFTQLEIYEAYVDYEAMMKLVEEIFGLLSEGKEIEYQGKKIRFKEWQKIKFFDSFEKYTGENVENKSTDELVKFAEERGVPITRESYRGKILDSLFDSLVQPHLIEPTFIIDYPKDISPLAKEKRGDPNLVERFEVFVGGLELGNAFSELNDPLEQVARFEQQLKFREEGSLETQPLDEEFVEALSYGMPPTGGLGLGIDRIVMLFTNSYSIKDVLLFPPMRTQIQ